MKRILTLVAAAALCATSWSQLRPASWIGSGMVLQRGQVVELRGTGAQAGTPYRVQMMAGKKMVCKSALIVTPDGTWTSKLPALDDKVAHGGPYTLSIHKEVAGKVAPQAEWSAQDVLVGDVVFLSGQSNMELPVRRVMDKYAEEIERTANDRVRLLQTGMVCGFEGPLADVKTEGWKALNFNNSREFSALGYFIGLELQSRRGVPVGMVESAIGGSPIEAWLTKADLQAGGYREALGELDINADDDYRAIVDEYSRKVGHLWGAHAADQCVETPGAKPEWTDVNYDDSSWLEGNLEKDEWGDEGCLRGVHYLRQVVELGPEWERDTATLRLGTLVDADEAYVNGQRVGGTAYQYPPRIYTVPKGILKAGKNVIAIRLEAQGFRPSVIADKWRGLFLGGPSRQWLCCKHVAEFPLTGVWRHKYMAAMPPRKGGEAWQYTPTVLHNGMVAGLAGMRVSGCVWYQGESNAGRSDTYPDLLARLKALYRSHFGWPELPVIAVELADYGKDPGDGWRAVQKAQMNIGENDANAAGVAAHDLGEWNDIHPLAKKELALRVAEKLLKFKE